MSDAADRLAEVRALVHAEPVADAGPGAAGVLQRLCAVAVRTLPATGAGVSLLSEQGVTAVAAASDDRSEELEDLQVTLGEGPCVDAARTQRPVLEPDLDEVAASRWPSYRPAARELGVRAVFAFPLQVGAARLGVFDVYRSERGSLSRRSVDAALDLARVAVRTLLDGQAEAPPGATAEGVDDALSYRTELYQAQGMTMVDLGVSLTEAMSRLRAYAYAHDRRLGEVARDVVEGRLRLDGDTS